MRKYIFHRHSSGTESATTGRTVQPFVSELIITTSLIGIAQYFISLGCFFKLLFSFLIAGVLIRVILDSFFTVCLFYLLGRRIFSDTQHFIIISFFHCSLSYNLFPYHDFGKANNFVIERISLLHGIYHFTFLSRIRSREHRHSLVIFCIEIRSLRRNLLYAVLF